ncbi:MAG: ABC transporter substrate-binding protein [Thermotogaceae bacterium]|nr:ABC transporter substrate-binding protein [Thermotogaceae bacterium]
MLKKVFLIFGIIFSVHILALTLLNPYGPTILPVSFITNGEIGRHLEVSFWRTPEEAVASIKVGKADFYILPITLGANLYSKEFDIVLLGVHEWKVFYMVGKQEISDLKDLKGKTIYCAHTRGTVVDVLLRYILEEAGLNPDIDVIISYAQPNEIVSLFKAGKIEYAALPEPFVTMITSSKSGKIVLDFQKEWSKSTGLLERIPIAGLFTTKSFLKNHSLEAEYAELALWVSTEEMNKRKEEAVDAALKILKMPKSVLINSLSRMVFYYIPISKCKKDVEKFLKVLHEKYPEGVQKLPDDGFYWIK